MVSSTLDYTEKASSAFVTPADLFLTDLTTDKSAPTLKVSSENCESSSCAFSVENSSDIASCSKKFHSKGDSEQRYTDLSSADCANGSLCVPATWSGGRRSDSVPRNMNYSEMISVSDSHSVK